MSVVGGIPAMTGNLLKHALGRMALALVILATFAIHQSPAVAAEDPLKPVVESGEASDTVEEVDEAAEGASSETGESDSASEGENVDAETVVEEAEPAASGEAVELPEIITDLETIPFPVRKMRELILEAARAGDVEMLRRYIGFGDDVTMLSLGGHDEDPIEFLKSLSGDPEGHEILAIITEILEAPAVKIEQAPGQEVYVWPYFYSYPFDKLTPEQRVQLFRLITYGDYEEMLSFGSYIFYRLGITPEGRWQFFVAGD